MATDGEHGDELTLVGLAESLGRPVIVYDTRAVRRGQAQTWTYNPSQCDAQRAPIRLRFTEVMRGDEYIGHYELVALEEPGGERPPPAPPTDNA